jgi:hypothetical protein
VQVGNLRGEIHMKLLLASSFALLLVSSCGDKKKDYSGTLGTCTSTVPVIGETCVAYTYSAKKQKDDPKATVQSQTDSACTSTSGTWSATGTCATTGALGTCSSTSTSGDTTVSSSTYFYANDTITADVVQSSCTEGGGTFTAP